MTSSFMIIVFLLTPPSTEHYLANPEISDSKGHIADLKRDPELASKLVARSVQISLYVACPVAAKSRQLGNSAATAASLAKRKARKVR